MSALTVIRTASGLSIILALSAWINAGEPNEPPAQKPAAPKSSFAQETPDQAVARLVEQLRRHPVQPKEAPDRFGLFMMDVSNGEATLMPDQPGPGLTQCGSPVWSHDGRRIVFDATPGREYRLSRLESIDLVEGRLKITDLGTGNCPTFSPADDRIAFLSNGDDVERGVWVMNADGSGRRFLGDYGRPAWSPDGRQLMMISFQDPRRVTLMDANPDKSGLLRLPGQQIYAYPSWAGVGTIVAAIGVTEADTVALIDVSDPAQAKVKEVLWRRENGPDVMPSESIYSAATRRCIFIGSGAKGVALYSVEQGQAGVAKRLGLGGYHPAITSLAESPDGRYILYHVHGLQRPRPGLAAAGRDAAKEVATTTGPGASRLRDGSAAVPAQVPAGAPVPSSYLLWEFGTIPRPAFKEVLLGVPAVQRELKLTEAQKRATEETRKRQFENIQKARGEITDRQKFLTARDTIFKEIQRAILDNLEPRQRDRLDQIQLQSQGPMAFRRFGNLRLAMEEPDLAQRLKLTGDQVKRAQAIAAEGEREIEKAATVPIVLDSKAGVPTRELIRKLVETPQFKAAKQKTREAAHKAWASVMQRIEQVLTEPQRTAYHEMLGVPFDLLTIRFSEDESAEDAEMVADTLNVGGRGGGGGGGGGQQSDPNFDTKVARPSYKTEHPRVLFDEAHNNFHTSGGRYKPFAEMIANDGFQVMPSKGKFTKEMLAKGDILIIANALGAEGMGQAGASDSAFTEAECDAVRDWVRAGGSLLLITDHAPFGAAAESLAKRFGVDMSKGSTSDPSNSEGGEASLVFSRKNNLLGDHPIMQGRDDSERINRIQTFSGQSLKGPAGSVAILKLADTAVDEGNDGKPTSAAGRAQGIAFAFGKGRVVVMGEAAELSAQIIGTERYGMNVPGLDNRQMALNILHWLSGLLEPHGGAQKKAA